MSGQFKLVISKRSLCFCQMDYRVVLMAVHAVAGRADTIRVCGVLLNVVNCLIDIGVVVSTTSGPPTTSGTTGIDSCKTQPGNASVKNNITTTEFQEDSTFCLATETVFRLFTLLNRVTDKFLFKFKTRKQRIRV